MADTKISDLTALTGANVADDDEFVIVDTSAAQSKRITRAELAQGLYQGDNVRLKIGASSDLQLYHDGTHSYISDQGTGNLRIAASDRIQFYNAATDEVTAQFIANGEAELRYDNTTRLSTTSTGIDVTGTVTADGLTVDTSDPVLRLTDSDTGETATVKTSGAGHLILDASQANAAGNGNVYVRTQASTLRALFNYNGDIAFYDSTGTSQNLFWDASASRLGIGVTAPSQVLHVKDSSTNAYARVTATTNTGIDFGQETNGNGLINLRDSASLRIFTSGTERMRLTSAGLLVGKTAQALATVGAEILGSIGRIQATRDSGAPGGFNRKTNDGDIVAFYKDATQVGSIGNHDATSAYIGSSDTGLRFNVGSDSVTPYDPSTKANRDAAIDLGHPSIRFKDLYLSGTIQIEKGTGNVGVGKLALNSNTSSNNTAVGYSAMSANTTGVNISSVGHTSLQANTTGSSLVAVGTSALYANTTGSFSVAIGQQALRFNTTASNNTAVGHQAGYSNTNNANTFVGYQAGYSTNNVGNTFCGASAGSSVTSGSKNTIVGRFNGNENGLDIRTASNRIVLSDGDGNPRAYWGAAGEMVTQSSSTSDYALRAASTNTTGYPIISEFTGGAPNNTTNRFFTCRDTSADRMYVYSNGNVVNTNNSYGALSDEKLKENIVDSGSQWDDIKALRVRKYSMKEDALDAPNKLGVIAQELEAAGMGGLVFESPDRDRDNNDLGTVTKQVNYSILYMKAVKALQEAMERIETLEAKVTALENA